MHSSTSTSEQQNRPTTNGRTLFLGWQDPDQRRWFTIGRLDQSDEIYKFCYTKGAKKARKRGFSPLVSFPDLYRTYKSEKIFPLFANQVLSKNRPEYDDLVDWLSIPKCEADPIAILARTGEQVTDTLEIFPYPEKLDENTHRVHFFIRGLRHQSSCAVERSKTLESGETLRPIPDIQNNYDTNACLLRTAEQKEQDMHLMGYLPRYLAREFNRLSEEQARRAKVEVVRVNPPPAPIHFRILCRLIIKTEGEFLPFSDEVYQPITNGNPELAIEA
jgi:hypothetical protein